MNRLVCSSEAALVNDLGLEFPKPLNQHLYHLQFLSPAVMFAARA